MSTINKKPYAQKVIESLGQADLEALASAINGVVETLPALPTSNGTYTLKLTVLNGVNTFSWVLDS